jgi:hypothetical protein
MQPRHPNHADDCGWHLDQYSWECTCGAIPDPDKFKPEWLKAATGQTAQNEE